MAYFGSLLDEQSAPLRREHAPLTPSDADANSEGTLNWRFWWVTVPGMGVTALVTAVLAPISHTFTTTRSTTGPSARLPR